MKKITKVVYPIVLRGSAYALILLLTTGRAGMQVAMYFEQNNEADNLLFTNAKVVFWLSIAQIATSGTVAFVTRFASLRRAILRKNNSAATVSNGFELISSAQKGVAGMLIALNGVAIVIILPLVAFGANLGLITQLIERQQGNQYLLSHKQIISIMIGSALDAITAVICSLAFNMPFVKKNCQKTTWFFFNNPFWQIKKNITIMLTASVLVTVSVMPALGSSYFNMSNSLTNTKEFSLLLFPQRGETINEIFGYIEQPLIITAVTTGILYTLMTLVGNTIDSMQDSSFLLKVKNRYIANVGMIIFGLLLLLINAGDDFFQALGIYGGSEAAFENFLDINDRNPVAQGFNIVSAVISFMMCSLYFGPAFMMAMAGLVDFLCSGCVENTPEKQIESSDYQAVPVNDSEENNKVEISKCNRFCFKFFKRNKNSSINDDYGSLKKLSLLS